MFVSVYWMDIIMDEWSYICNNDEINSLNGLQFNDYSRV